MLLEARRARNFANRKPATLKKETTVNEANKAVVCRFYEECLNRHNPGTYAEFYSEVVYHAPAIGELHGEAHRQLLITVFRGFPDGHWTIKDQIGDQEKVATHWTFVGTHNGMFKGIPATGRQIRYSGISIDRVANGKIVEEWEEWDTLGVLHQLGALGPGSEPAKQPEICPSE
jgi:steroid delta-isomerase-like uncharacterized protein